MAEERAITKRAKTKRHYQLLSCDLFRDMASKIQASDPERFTYHESKWEKFNDGTDKIELGGFRPTNEIRGEHILFLASFHNNDATLSQFHALIVLLESFIESLTVVLPFYPTATMERVAQEGTIATASTLARLFNSLPSCGRPTCLVVYDIHTLQNRFYLSGNCLPQLETTIPLLKLAMTKCEVPVDAVAFPDEGAAKRFGGMFNHLSVVICGKVRDGDRRIVTVQDGDPSKAQHIVIVDDLVQSGGTLYEAAKGLVSGGAKKVSAFCAHAVFPQDSWKRFLRGGDRDLLDTFWVSNSIPSTVSKLPQDDVFQVLDIMPKLIEDLQ
mmetsp:Transcript_35969/g.42298  ORF Transcript_35969/g.42298 Transcript_35969/m.42298 type:complete len:327 (-) Transcript_35969:233-1213(-)